MKHKKAIVSLILFVLLLGGGVLFAFVTPLVVYVVPNVPEGVVERFSYPSFLGKGYWSLHLKEENLKLLSSLREPDLLIYSPLTPVDKTTSSRTLQWGTRESNADISVVLNEDTMWEDVLKALGNQPVGILAERFDPHDQNIFSLLEKNYPNLVRIVYDGRINNINRPDILREMDALYAVLVPTPLEKESVLRTTKSRVVVDEREAVSLVSMNRVLSASLDWDQLVPMALEMEEGTLDAHYTLTVLH